MKSTIVALGVLASVSIVSGAWAKNVTLVVGGTSHEVRTRLASVEDLLDDQGLPLTIGLQVQPPPSTALADGMTVVVSPPPGVPADGLSIAVSSTGVGVWVVERPEAGPFGKAEPSTEGAAAPAAGVGPPGVSVRAVVAGKVHDVSTNASTTGALLTAMGIQPDADDRVVPPLSTPLHDGSTVQYDQISTVVHSVSKTIPYPVSTDYTSTLVPGTVHVVQHGSPGAVVATVQDRIVNGRVVERSLVSRTVLRMPVAERRVSAPYSMYSGTLREPGTGATTQRGQASWYDPPWGGFTAAHPWLPFGTHVTVTDLATGRSVTVVIDDRGPFAPGKIIDLSPEAFAVLRPLGTGVIDVQLSW